MALNSHCKSAKKGGNSMIITFDNALERDMDLLFMWQFAKMDIDFINLFMAQTAEEWNDKCSIDSISHSVMTSDGESDVQVIINNGKEKVAFLIEDKIDAIAQPDQSKRYQIRAEKAVEQKLFSKYYIFIVAPQRYLDGNQEAQKYPHKVSYEQIRDILTDAFDKALVDKALDESKLGYVPVEDRKVTDFWNHIYDFVEENYPDTFNVHGKKGESRGANANWIGINSGHGTTIQIKADRGFVDLEIAGYADQFQKFSKDNQAILDKKRLCVRVATKSLAIRKYIEPIDFTENFSNQLENIEDAFAKAKELQDLVKDLKF